MSSASLGRANCSNARPDPIEHDGCERPVATGDGERRLKFVRTFHQPWPDSIEGEEEGDVEYALLKSEWERLLGERGRDHGCS